MSCFTVPGAIESGGPLITLSTWRYKVSYIMNIAFDTLIFALSAYRTARMHFARDQNCKTVYLSTVLLRDGYILYANKQYYPLCPVRTFVGCTGPTGSSISYYRWSRISRKLWYELRDDPCDFCYARLPHGVQFTRGWNRRVRRHGGLEETGMEPEDNSIQRTVI